MVSQLGQWQDVINPFMWDTCLPREINLRPGKLFNIPFTTTPHHNLEDDYGNVGRLDAIVQVSRFLVNKVNFPELFKNYKENAYLNLYGIPGVGKTTLMKESKLSFLGSESILEWNLLDKLRTGSF